METSLCCLKKRTNQEQVREHHDRHDQSEDREQFPERIVAFSQFIKQKAEDLVYMMKTQYGLLDELVSNKLLDAKQVSRIQEKDSFIGQAKQCLEEITKEIKSDETIEVFLSVLDQTHHKHVSNFIRGNGNHAVEFGDDWPVNYCIEFRKMTANRSSLIKLVDSRNGLLDAMLSADCINDQHKHSVEEGTTNENQNTMLFNIVIWGSLANYNAFIRCLLQTKQHQVVSLLAPRLVGDIRPLSDDQQSRLKRHFFTLVDIINSRDGLLDELFAADCITWRQKEYVDSAVTHSQSNQRLLDIVRRGSERNYHKFVECLNSTAQNHVCRILIHDGAVAYVVATISPANSREQHEILIVDQLKTLLRSIPSDRREGVMNEAMSEVRQPMNQLHDNEITILTAEIGHSIRIFYFILSLRGLQYFREMYSNKQLQSLMQEIFTLLLKTDDAAPDLRVDTLRWDFSNFTDCVQQLCNGLPILYHVYEMAKQNQQLGEMCDDVRAIPIDQLPFELIEIILVRAARNLFATLSRTVSRAEIYTLATLTAVSRLWWVSLSYRKYIKRLLKRSFEQVCRPFKCSPQRGKRLHIGGGNNVRGIAVFNDKLLVACRRSHIIQVFESRPPFSRREDIQVEGLDRAVDITVCNKLSLLYIADVGMPCAIWRVNLLAMKRTDTFLPMQWKPLSMSINSSRLLITPRVGASLYLYDDDGNELHRIELPRFMAATHAVETTHKTYLVCHYNRFIDDPLHRDSVTEVDVYGRVVRSFNDDLDHIQFNVPCYLVLDNNHVIIADCYNDRIILQKSSLQMERVLIDSLHGERPYRLCLTSSRLLAVSYAHSADIDIYQV